MFKVAAKDEDLEFLAVPICLLRMGVNQLCEFLQAMGAGVLPELRVGGRCALGRPLGVGGAARSLRLQFDQSLTQRDHDRLKLGSRLELRHHVAHVTSDRMRGDPKMLGDLLRAHAVSQRLEDLKGSSVRADTFQGKPVPVPLQQGLEFQVFLVRPSSAP